MIFKHYNYEITDDWEETINKNEIDFDQYSKWVESYEMLMFINGYRSYIKFPKKNGAVMNLVVLSERYEKYILKDGSVLIKVYDEYENNIVEYLCNKKTKLVFVPALYGEQYHLTTINQLNKKDIKDIINKVLLK